MAYRPNWYSGEGYRRGGWRTWTAIGTLVRVTLAVFLIEWVLAVGKRIDILSAMFAVGGLNVWFADGSLNWFFPIQFFTYPFLHDVSGFMHVAWNMLLLWMFGRELEDVMGKKGFFRLYFGGAVAGAILQSVWALSTQDITPVIGASGAVFAVMTVYAFRWPNRMVLVFFFIPMKVMWLVTGIVVIEVMRFIEQLGGAQYGTAIACHLGGAAFGYLWFRRGDMVAALADKRRRDKAMKEWKRENVSRREMDRILAKIQGSGLSSLTPDEREFLDRRSREIREAGR